MVEPWTVVGAGLSGATVARVLAEGGLDVAVYEKQPLVGGLAADVLQPDGTYRSLYGPHVFHTSDEQALAWMRRFGRMEPRRWRVYARTGSWGDLPVPLTLPAVERVAGAAARWEMHRRERPGTRLSWAEAAERYPALGPALDVVFGRYTQRMWDGPATPAVRSRVAAVVVTDAKDAPYFAGDSFVGQPEDGYTRLLEAMLDHPRIRLTLCYAHEGGGDRTIWTAPRDDVAGEPLRWRGMVQGRQRIAMPVGGSVLNLPEAEGPLRVTAYGAVACGEMPLDAPPAPRQYPDPAASIRAPSWPRCLGRLGTYRYLNMDQCILEALALGTDLVEGETR